MEPDEKECPFCAEVIKAKARKCKHCQSLLTKKKIREIEDNIEKNSEEIIKEESQRTQTEVIQEIVSLAGDIVSKEKIETPQINIVCPKCLKQNLYDYKLNQSLYNFQCKSCNIDFISRIAKVRSKNSKGYKKNNIREYSIRIIDFSNSEDIIRFDTYGYYNDIDLRSKDIAIFSYLDRKVIIVQNSTLGKYIQLSHGIIDITENVSSTTSIIVIGVVLLIIIILIIVNLK